MRYIGDSIGTVLLRVRCGIRYIRYIFSWICLRLRTLPTITEPKTMSNGI